MSGIEALIAQSAALRGFAGLVLGAAAGSGIATLVIRWPDRRRSLIGRSRCDACGRPLEWREIAPAISFFALGGRCRSCRVPIEPRHLVMELGAATLGMLTLALQSGWMGLASAVLGWWLLLVAMLDLDSRWLPRLLTVPLVPTGLALALVGIGPSLVERAAAAATAFALTALLAFLWRRTVDRAAVHPGAPLLAAGLGAWLGAWLIAAALLAGLLGFVASLVASARRGRSAAPLALGACLAIAGWLVWLVAAPYGGLLPL